MTAVRSPRLNVTRMGRPGGATVVLVHGIAMDNLASYYFTVAPACAAAGHQVVMYDQRGHGRSERPASGYRLEDFTGDLAALLDGLRPCGDVHLVGTSFGGTVALDYALHHPGRLASVLVVESEPPTPAWAGKLSGILADAARRLRDERALPWLAEHYGGHEARLGRRSCPLLHGTTAAEDIAASRVPAEDRWRTLDVPVLAVYGGASDLAETAPRLESLLPDCRTVRVDGYGHSVLVEAPRTVAAILVDWLGSGHRAGAAVRT